MSNAESSSSRKPRRGLSTVEFLIVLVLLAVIGYLVWRTIGPVFYGISKAELSVATALQV